MLKSILILTLVVGAYSTKYWKLYKSAHGKKYSKAEEALRREIFNKNLKIIIEHNILHDLGLRTWRMGLNQFTDMTADEFRNHKGLLLNASRLHHAGHRFKHKKIHLKDLPKHVDWRDEGYVTPVKNQGHCGSCWAFSTVGSLEGQFHNLTKDQVQFSESNLVDCSHEGNHGCQGGSMDKAFEYIKKNGINTEAIYPYEPRERECRFDPSHWMVRISGYVYVPRGDEIALQKAVAKVGPISVAIDATGFQFYKEGVFVDPNCSSTVLDHAVLVVGYGATHDDEFWLVKNSWGTEWGENGYIRMKRNSKNQCGIASFGVFPLIDKLTGTEEYRRA